MGRWGNKSFESDFAQDWLQEFIDDPTCDLLDEAIENVLKDNSQPEVDQCDQLIAAANLYLAVCVPSRRRSLDRTLVEAIESSRIKLSLLRCRRFIKALTKVAADSESRDLAAEEDTLRPWIKSIEKTIDAFNAISKVK